MILEIFDFLLAKTFSLYCINLSKTHEKKSKISSSQKQIEEYCKISQQLSRDIKTNNQISIKFIAVYIYINI